MSGEFDRVMARAGVSVPPAWYTGTEAAFRELMAMTELLRDEERPVGSEPSAVYRVSEWHGGHHG
ncbi:hypothetical protein [Streptomyces sp. NPDC096339]|uniref:hypothetical protein n=1 Tax=Streptomyces sp. NPDC096339 TaxID=3366086 RepID=UPI0038030773